jgi:Ca2+:H+ antiporter
MHIFTVVFQLYSHSHYYNPDSDQSNSPPTSRASSPSPSHRLPSPIPAPVANAPKGHHGRALPVARMSDPVHGPRRANSMPGPFGSARALGGVRQPLAWARGVGPHAATGVNARFSEKRETDARLRGRNPGAHAGETRREDVERDDTSSSSSDSDEEEVLEMNLTVALLSLVAATGLTYVTAEALTSALEEIGAVSTCHILPEMMKLMSSQSGTVSPEWLGLILLAVVGNAAEHVTAVIVAYKNKVDLALAVSVGSCIQIALFVIPLLVLLGWIVDKPMSLLFDPLETITLFLSVLLVRFATEDGRTHYMSGVALVGTCELFHSSLLH